MSFTERMEYFYFEIELPDGTTQTIGASEDEEEEEGDEEEE